MTVWFVLCRSTTTKTTHSPTVHRGSSLQWLARSLRKLWMGWESVWNFMITSGWMGPQMKSTHSPISFKHLLKKIWSGHLQEKRSVICWFVRNRLAFLWISVGQSKMKYVKMWKDVPNRRNSNVPLVDNDLRRIVQRLECHAKDDGVEGVWFHLFLKCSFIKSDVDALFDRFGKMILCCCLSMMREMMQQSDMKPDAMCRRLNA